MTLSVNSVISLVGPAFLVPEYRHGFRSPVVEYSQATDQRNPGKLLGGEVGEITVTL